MKLTKKAQEMMDILEDAFADVEFADPVAWLTYEDREVKITQEIFNYNYGEKEGPKSSEAAEEHKVLKEFLKNIEADQVDVEIILEEDIVGEGFDMIMEAKEDECMFDNLR